jgi:hypothetical protein
MCAHGLLHKSRLRQAFFEVRQITFDVWTFLVRQPFGRDSFDDLPQRRFRDLRAQFAVNFRNPVRPRK